MKRSKKNSGKKTYKPVKKTQKSIPENKIFNLTALIALATLTGIIAFGKYMSGEYLFFFKDIGSDSINQNYPAIVHKINMLKEGFFAKWSFYKGIGDKYITGIATEPYGIIRQLTDYAGANIGGVNYFVFGRFLKIFIFYFLGTAAVAFLYFRTLSIKRFPAFTGSLLIAFSGYMVAGAGWDFSSHIFKAMFLLFAFEQLYLKKHWYFFPFAVIWLSGNPFVLFIYTVFLFLYSLFRYFSEQNSVKNYLKLTGKMILLGFAGLMMNFYAFSKSLIKMYDSPRVAGNASYDKLLSSGQTLVEHTNLGTSTILRFFSVDILGSGSNFAGWFNYLEAPLFYIGILTLLLVPQIFIHLNKRKKITFALFISFWILTLVIPLLRYALLAFTGDYFRYGFDFFIPFTLLFYGIYALNEICKTSEINIKLLIATFLILTAALFFPYGSLPENAIQKDIRNIAELFLVIYAILIFALSKPKYKTFARYALIILVATELSYFSYRSYSERIPLTGAEFLKTKAGYADGTEKVVDYLKKIDKTPFFRTEKDYRSGNSVHGSLNDAMAQGYFGTSSYSSFNQLNYVRFLEKTGLIAEGDETSSRWITGFINYPLMLTFGNVKYILSKSKHPESEKFGFEKIAEKYGITILKNKYYLPFGYTYDKYTDFNDFKKLTEYNITLQSLNGIYRELSQKVKPEELISITERLKPLLNKEYPDYKSFSDAIISNIGKDNARKYQLIITKYSIQNFKNQIALLSGFVYEKEYNNIDLKNFKQINLSDTDIIMPARKFNFDIYKAKTELLKQDTFKITKFKQSDIEGEIDLPKTKMLFFTIPYDEGWKAEVNGKQATLQRINTGFTGIVLPKGKHKIRLYYVPKYMQTASIITIISVILFWSYIIYFFLFKKRKTA